MLDGLIKILNEEAGRNPGFAERLQALSPPVPIDKPESNETAKIDQKDVPDAYAEFASRGESEFRLCLRNQSAAVLQALIRRHELDATRRSAKWKGPEKLSAYITDQIRSRLARGSDFLKSGNSSPANPAA